MPKIRNDSWYKWMSAWRRVRRFLYDTGAYGDNDVSTIGPVGIKNTCAGGQNDAVMLWKRMPLKKINHSMTF